MASNLYGIGIVGRSWRVRERDRIGLAAAGREGEAPANLGEEEAALLRRSEASSTLYVSSNHRPTLTASPRLQTVTSGQQLSAATRLTLAPTAWRT